MRPLLVIVVLLSAATAMAADPASLTLNDCFERALRQSETLAISNEAIEEARAHYYQALGTVLPNISLKGSEFIQDTSGVAGDGSTIGATFFKRYRPEASLSASMPLFQGLREFQALRVAGAEKRQARLERDRARQLLFFDVARAYVTVIELERELKIVRDLTGTLEKRVADLKKREQLGKSRLSEVLSTESHWAVQTAELKKVGGQVATARDMLGFLTGDPVTERLVDVPPPPLVLDDEASFVAQVSARPDVAASREGVRLAKGKVAYEWGGHLPSVNAEANYYLYRTGFQKEINWDVMLRADLPLFSGLTTHGKVKEAKAERRQAQFADREAARRAELEVRQAYHDLTSVREQEEALNWAETKAAASYRLVTEDYDLGLVNNLEVLQSLRDWKECLREANRSRAQANLSYLQLTLAAGAIPDNPFSSLEGGGEGRVKDR